MSHGNFKDLTKLKALICSQIVAAWEAKVQRHILQNPIDFNVLKEYYQRFNLPDHQINETLRDNRAQNSIVYACTLLCALITDSFAVYAQIGDGVIRLVNSSTISSPFPDEKQKTSDEVTPLGDPYAASLFHFSASSQLPETIFISTDGLTDCYADDGKQWFLDVSKIIRENGLDRVNSELKDWLGGPESPARGPKAKQDDCTVGIIHKIDSGRKTVDMAAIENKLIQLWVGCTTINLFKSRFEPLGFNVSALVMR